MTEGLGMYIKNCSIGSNLHRPLDHPNVEFAQSKELTSLQAGMGMTSLGQLSSVMLVSMEMKEKFREDKIMCRVS